MSVLWGETYRSGGRSSVCWAVVSVGMIGLAPPILSADDRSTGDIGRLREQLEQVEALAAAQQARMRDLRRRARDAGLDAAGTGRTDEVRRLVQDLMAEGAFRGSLYPDLQQVGYDRGFYIRSADEAFELIVRGFAKFRYTALSRQTDNPRRQGRQRQDDIHAFEVEDLRVIFDGHIHTPKLTYKIDVTGDADAANQWRIFNAYANYEFAKEFQITAGISKVPFTRQELNSRYMLQFVDRSLANEAFTFRRSLGVFVHGTFAGRVSYAVAVMNGLDNREDIPCLELDSHFAYAARTVAHLLGKPIKGESDLAYSKEPQLEVGLSFACNDDNGDRRPSGFYGVPDRIRWGRGIGGYGTVDLTGTELLQFGGDVAFRYRGFSVTGEWWIRCVDGDSEFSAWELRTARGGSVRQQGGYVQAGYFIVPKKVEVAGRISGVLGDDGERSWEYAFGVNYFPLSTYNVLLQADLTRIDGAPTGSANGNWSQNDEVDMIRVQMQLMF